MRFVFSTRSAQSSLWVQRIAKTLKFSSFGQLNMRHGGCRRKPQTADFIHTLTHFIETIEITYKVNVSIYQTQKPISALSRKKTVIEDFDQDQPAQLQ